MDQVILAQKLESLRRCIRRVEQKIPADVNQLVQDPDCQDILVLNLTPIVKAKIVIPVELQGPPDERGNGIGQLFGDVAGGADSWQQQCCQDQGFVGTTPGW